MPTVSFKLTESARRTIARHCADRGHGPSVPEIIWKQKIEGTAVGEWGIGYHPADLWDSREPEFKFVIDGQKFLISLLSPPLLDLLNGAVLDVNESGSLCFRKA